VPEELDGVDADDAGGLDLLGLAQRSTLFGVEAVDAGLAAGDHAVHDVFALAGPARDRGGRAVFEVVGVGDDGERAVPVLGEGLVGFGPKVGHRVILSGCPVARAAWVRARGLRHPRSGR